MEEPFAFGLVVVYENRHKEAVIRDQIWVLTQISLRFILYQKNLIKQHSSSQKPIGISN